MRSLRSPKLRSGLPGEAEHDLVSSNKAARPTQSTTVRDTPSSPARHQLPAARHRLASPVPAISATGHTLIHTRPLSPTTRLHEHPTSPPRTTSRHTADPQAHTTPPGPNHPNRPRPTTSHHPQAPHDPHRRHTVTHDHGGAGGPSSPHSPTLAAPSSTVSRQAARERTAPQPDARHPHQPGHRREQTLHPASRSQGPRRALSPTWRIPSTS